MNRQEYEALSPQEQLQAKINAVLAHYGWADMEQMKASKEFAAIKDRLQKHALKNNVKYPSNVAVLDELNTPSTEETANGWFIRNAKKTKKNKSGAFEVIATGPLVLFGNGSAIPVWNGQTIEGPSIVTKVSVSPVRISRNLVCGDVTVTIPTSAKVSESDHNETLPHTNLDDFEAKCMQLTKRRTIRGDTGDDLVFFTLNVSSEPNDIKYFETSDFKEGETFKLVAFDEEGRGVNISPDVSDTRFTFGIREGDPAAVYRERLKGEPLSGLGRYKNTSFLRLADFGEHAAEAQAVIEELNKTGQMVEYKKSKNGTPLFALDLNKQPEGVVFITIGGHNVYRIEEVEMDGKVEWQFIVLARDLRRYPTIEVVEKPWSNARGMSGIMNQGATLIWLSRVGGSFASDEAKAMAAAAKQLGLDDLE